MDLVVTNQDAVANWAGGKNVVRVFLNKGKGAFAPFVEQAVDAVPASAAIGDLDADGDNDLVVAGASGLHVLLNHGDATFAAKVTYAPSGHGVGMADLDADGDRDLVVVGNNKISVLSNHGDGTFADEVDYASTWPEAIALGDLDGNGTPDVAVANFAGAAISVFMNHGDGTLAPKVEYPGGSYPRAIAIGDLNGDGKADIAIPNYESQHVVVVMNEGAGTFAAPVTYASGADPRGIAIADFDGDGRFDLAVASERDRSVAILRSTGSLCEAPGSDAGAPGADASAPPVEPAVDQPGAAAAPHAPQEDGGVVAHSGTHEGFARQDHNSVTLPAEEKRGGCSMAAPRSDGGLNLLVLFGFAALAVRRRKTA